MLRSLKYIVDGTCHQEAALRNLVALAVQNHTEATQGLLQRNIASRHTGKLLCYREALGQETLYLTCPVYRLLILLVQLIHTHDGDDILQLFVSLQHLLYGTCYLIVLMADDFRCQDTEMCIRDSFGVEYPEPEKC